MSDQNEITDDHVRALFIWHYRMFKGNPGYGRHPIPQWDGGEDRHGRNHKPVWPKLAKHIQGLKVDPECYIAAQFWAADVSRAPFPTALMNEDAYRRYLHYQQTIVPELQHRFRSEYARIVAAARFLVRTMSWTEERAAAYAACDRLQVTASALVRYCFGVLVAGPAAVAQFRDAAAQQYRRHRQAYDAALTGWIPDELRAGAPAANTKG